MKDRIVELSKMMAKATVYMGFMLLGLAIGDLINHPRKSMPMHNNNTSQYTLLSTSTQTMLTQTQTILTSTILTQTILT